MASRNALHSALTSPSNPEIKQIRALRKRQARDESGLFLVEGIRPVGEAIRALFPADNGTRRGAERERGRGVTGVPVLRARPADQRLRPPPGAGAGGAGSEGVCRGRGAL